jgi:type I restriction-modification system DNA methylase subunit
VYKEFYEYEKSVASSKKRSLGIVYTPVEIVDTINRKMLADWTSPVPPKVLDPCCGTGVFLYDMAHKISERWSIPLPEVYKKYIYGFDIDSEAVNIGCEIMESSNLMACDSLRQDYAAYDIIVTNPPYVRIQHLSEQQRSFIQKEFDFTGGDTDIYIAFLEKLAKSKVDVGLISPSSWARNKSSASLRQYFYEQRCVRELIDFGDRIVFEGVQTYTSILYMGHSEEVRYNHHNPPTSSSIKYIDSDPERIFLGLHSRDIAGQARRLADLCDIKVGLATLADGLFYGERTSVLTNGLVRFRNKHGEYTVEAASLRKCTKASKIQKIKDNTYIIYPYTKEGKLIREEEMASKFPNTYNLLLGFKDILLSRDRGKIKEEKWYGFGRTQGLRSSGPKLLLPPFQKDQIVVREAAEEDMFISGYAVYPKDGYSLASIKEVLTSKELFEYIKPFAKPMSNGWVGISKNTFKHYTF